VIVGCSIIDKRFAAGFAGPLSAWLTADINVKEIAGGV
jgi:hypothetical protein